MGSVVPVRIADLLVVPLASVATALSFGRMPVNGRHTGKCSRGVVKIKGSASTICTNGIAKAVDASFGYSSLEADQFRASPTTGAIITSDPDSDRWFGMLNVNGLTIWNNWIIGGRIGTLWARNTQESFTESDGTVNAEITSKLGTWSIGGDVAYSYGEWEPFVRATYERDYSLTEIRVFTGPQPSNDRDDFLVGAGLRYFSVKGITGNFEWNKRLGRNHFDEDTFTFTIRADF